MIENDTWSASAVPQNDNVDSEWFILEGRSHGDSSIKNMTLAEKKKLVDRLEKWLGLEIGG